MLSVFCVIRVCALICCFQEVAVQTSQHQPNFDELVSESRDGNCRKPLQGLLSERIPLKDVLRRIKLHWATSVYHGVLDLSDVANNAVEGDTSTESCIGELLAQFSTRKSYWQTRPWGGKGWVADSVVGFHEKSTAEPTDALLAGFETKLEEHVQQYLAAMWKHPLLDMKGGESAALTVQIVDSWVIWLQGDAKDTLLPWDRLQAQSLIGLLSLHDAGDATCNSSSTLRIRDPRGVSIASMPPVLQLGAHTNICMRTGEIWVLPSSLEVQLLPHRNRSPRAVLLFTVRLLDVTHPALIDLFLPPEAAGDSSAIVLTRGRASGWRAWHAAEQWSAVLQGVLVRWPTPVYSATDLSVLSVLPPLAELLRCVEGEGVELEGGEASLDLLGEQGMRAAPAPETAEDKKEEGERGRARCRMSESVAHVRERLTVHLQGVVQGLASHPFMTRYNREPSVWASAELEVSHLSLRAWGPGAYSPPAVARDQAAAQLSGWWYVCAGMREGREDAGEVPAEVREQQAASEQDGVQLADPRAPAARVLGEGSRVVGVEPGAGVVVVVPSCVVAHHGPHRGPRHRVALAFHAQVRFRERGRGEAANHSRTESEETIQWVR